MQSGLYNGICPVTAYIRFCTPRFLAGSGGWLSGMGQELCSVPVRKKESTGDAWPRWLVPAAGVANPWSRESGVSPPDFCRDKYRRKTFLPAKMTHRATVTHWVGRAAVAGGGGMLWCLLRRTSCVRRAGISTGAEPEDPLGVEWEHMEDGWEGTSAPSAVGELDPSSSHLAALPLCLDDILHSLPLLPFS